MLVFRSEEPRDARLHVADRIKRKRVMKGGGGGGRVMEGEVKMPGEERKSLRDGVMTFLTPLRRNI